MGRQLEEPVRAMLQFIARVAHAQPMQPLSYEAEQLLIALYAESYLHPCTECHETPTQQRGDAWFCDGCREELNLIVEGWR